MIRELLVLTALFASAPVQGVDSRSIERLLVQELVDPSRQVDVEPAPIQLGHHRVLALINPHSNTGTRLLAQFAQSGFDGRGITVVVLDEPEAPSVYRNTVERSLLPQAHWVRASSRDVLPLLDLSGTPLLLGIDPRGVVRWQRAGVPERIDTWLIAIHDWVERTPPHRPPDAELSDEEEQ